MGNPKTKASGNPRAGRQDDEFSDRLGMVAAAAQLQAQLQAQLRAPAPKPDAKELPKPPVDGGRSGKPILIDLARERAEQAMLVAAQAMGRAQQGPRLRALDPQASPISRNVATSSNTAAMIAGLKPWSKDWVFEGGMDQNPAPRPLFGAGSDAGPNPPGAEPLKASVPAMTPGTESRGETYAMDETGARVSPRASLHEALLAEGNSGPGDHPSLQPAGDAHWMRNRDSMTVVSANHSDPAPIGKMAAIAGSPIFIGNGVKAGFEPETPYEGDARGATSVRVPRPGQGGRVIEIAPRQASLSGAEFMSTLDAVQGRGGNGDQLRGADGEAPTLRPRLLVDAGLRPASQYEDAGLHPASRYDEKKSADDELAPGTADAAASHSALSGLASSQQPDPTSGAGKAAFGGTGTIELTGRVTQGGMAQDRLSSESLLRLSTGIRNLAPQGGGEIRVRLKPENLGELHLRVVTDGSQVGLQIQATDEKAKKILEDSIGHLKDSLATHQLTLGRVDLTVTPPSHLPRGDMSNNQSPSGHPAFGGFHDMMGNRGGNGQRSDAWASRDGSLGAPQPTARGPALAGPMAGGARRSYSSSGRLDVRA